MRRGPGYTARSNIPPEYRVADYRSMGQAARRMKLSVSTRRESRLRDRGARPFLPHHSLGGPECCGTLWSVARTDQPELAGHHLQRMRRCRSDRPNRRPATHTGRDGIDAGGGARSLPALRERESFHRLFGDPGVRLRGVWRRRRNARPSTVIDCQPAPGN